MTVGVLRGTHTIEYVSIAKGHIYSQINSERLMLYLDPQYTGSPLNVEKCIIVMKEQVSHPRT